MPSINIDQINDELVRFKDQNPQAISGAVMSKEITLNKYAKTVTKIRGEFASGNTVLSNVVSRFKPEWEELGTAQLRGKLLKNFHQKINFGLIPAEILGSWYEKLYEEGKDLKDKSISKHIMDVLNQKIISDVDYLSINGVYNLVNANNLVFGASMDGWNQILVNAFANANNPIFKIPINAITDSNIVAEITSFERKLPKTYASMITRIFLSANDFERYVLAYEDQFGKNVNYTDNNKLYSRLGKRELVPINGMTDGTLATFVDGNLMKLVDLIDNPATITDVQKQDYKIKIFGEFTLGYDFGINELAIVSTTTNVNPGLGDIALNKLYYPNDKNLHS
jgi:hypothetical protein